MWWSKTNHVIGDLCGFHRLLYGNIGIYATIIQAAGKPREKIDDLGIFWSLSLFVYGKWSFLHREKAMLAPGTSRSLGVFASANVSFHRSSGTATAVPCRCPVQDGGTHTVVFLQLPTFQQRDPTERCWYDFNEYLHDSTILSSSALINSCNVPAGHFGRLW